MPSRYIQPSPLPDAQTFIYISDYAEIIEYDEIAGTNTVVSLSNASVNVTFSIAQPNVSVNIGNNRIWFNGSYTTGNTENIMYFDPPYGNDLQNTPYVTFSYDSVPPEKYVYRVNQPNPSGVTVIHTIILSNIANVVGTETHTVDRFVYHNIYAAINFMNTYDYVDNIEDYM